MKDIAIASDDENVLEMSGNFKFSTPRMFGRNKGSGIAVAFPVSATEFLLKVI